MEFFGRTLLQLIQSHGKLEVPGLGTFYGEYVGASLQFATRTILPATLRIEFDSRPTSGKDQHLSAFLKNEFGLEESVIQAGLDQFTQKAISGLSAFGKFDIPGFGILVKDIEGNIIFKSESDQSLLSDSFGLGKLQAETIFAKAKLESQDREAPVIPLHPFDDEIPEAKEFEQEKKGRMGWFAAGAVALAITISLSSIYFLNWQNQSGPVPQEANLVPMVSHSSPENKAVEKPLPMENEKITEPVQPTPVPEPEKPVAKVEAARFSYFVIAGSFKMEEKSQNLFITLKKKGFEASLLPQTETGQYRVSLESFSEKESALEFLHQNQSGFKEQLWIYKEPIQ
jgi:cell division septation protein DedD